MSSAMIEHADGLPQPQRNWAILTIALGLVMAVIDGAIANVALPTIAQDLHASPAFSIWIVNGYQLAITISLLPLASLGEIIGYRRVYLAGLVLFTAGFVLLRAVAHAVAADGRAHHAGIWRGRHHERQRGAGALTPIPRDLLGRGIGINALVVAVSAAVGPTVAAGILAVGTWPYLFAINIPFGIAALALGLALSAAHRRAGHSFDWQSAGLSAITFGLGIAAIDSVGHGETLLALPDGICASPSSPVSCWCSGRPILPSPLLPVDLLRIPIFALSIATSIASFCGQMLAFVALPFYLESHFGYSAVEIGLLITPWPIAVAFAAPLRRPAGRTLSRRTAGRHRPVAVRLRPRHPGADAGPPHAVRRGLAHGAGGAGFGLFQTPNNRTMIAAAPRERSGGASGMLGTARLLGQTTGAALVALFLARYPAEGTQISLLAGVGFALLGAALSMLRYRRPAREAPSGCGFTTSQRLKGE